MEREEIFAILSELLANEADEMPRLDERGGFLEVSRLDTLTDETTMYRYQVIDENKILVEKYIEDDVADDAEKTVTEKTFREIVWKYCRLKRVCAIYQKQYENWKQENNDIPYIETKINDESDGRPERSLEFIRNFWKEELTGDGEGNGNLRLLLAEYGFGKSSYCQGIRALAAAEIRTQFLEENAAFPFVFDLNRFRSGDFDKFIESELFASYRVSMVYPVFEKLCQSGIFMVVLDAWDQMHSARQVRRVKQDLNQMSPLWAKRGRALITCRRSFYQQQLKIKGNLSRNVGLFRLNGFDRESAVNYLEQKNEESRLKGEKPLIADAKDWIAARWERNQQLFEKPLNLKMLVRHFDTIDRQNDFQKIEVGTYRFLEIIFDEWRNKNHVGDAFFLKELVSQTLSSGLNRSVSLAQFLNAFAENQRESILEALSGFDFVRIDEKEGQIEFCLAAYQEFIWAYFAVQELKAEPSAFRFEQSLIRKYILIREVREWICTVLKKEEPDDCLKKQLDYVKYRSKDEVGFQGANALTLLCDLNSISDYKDQLKALKKDLWRRPLAETDFRGINLSGADFHGSDLEGADFSYTRLDGANFRTADLAQTVWDEHGEMKRCAFLNQKDALCVVAGTYNGGVLTYRIKEDMGEVVNLLSDVINDLAGDRGGIYTASSDGWVGYIDKNGNLRNAYIAQGGLQSIAHTNSENCVYVGAENEEIYRYNWNNGSRQPIEVGETLGSGEDRIADIHYYSNGSRKEYIAYTLKEKRLLVLLKMAGMREANVAGKGSLQTEGLKFGDICFADGMLIYSVVGRGVYGIPVSEMLYEIPERELVNDNQRLLELPDADKFFLGWANEKKELMIAARDKRSGQYTMYAVDFRSGKKAYDKLELEWLFHGIDYRDFSAQIKGFSVSDDGGYAAFSGEVLAVFENQGGYYSLAGEPIKAKISCKDADFSNSTGLNAHQVGFLKERGAALSGGGESSEQK